MITTGELLPHPLPHLETSLQTNVTRRVANAPLRDTACPAWRGESQPLTRELPLGPLFVIHAALQGLINREARGRRNIELAAPSDIELRHTVSHGHDQLR